MAAAVSGFLGFALSKVVDQFWTPVSGRECPEETNDVVHVAIDPQPPRPTEELLKPTATKPATQTQRQNARRNNRRKNAKSAAFVAVELPLDLASKTRSYSDADPAEISSNASTCGASDDEDEAEVEDIGAKEMRLMLERAQEIKRLTKQSRQSRQKDARSKAQPAKTKTQPQFPDVRSPIRLQNTTNGLWNWSVYSGFAVDAKVSNRGPRNMRNVFCSAAEAEQLESEQLLLDLAAQVLADN